jgi:hypothetical protein
VVTWKKANCIGCKQKGHFFLTKEKDTEKWVKNCPETYTKEKFIALKEESLKTIKEAEAKRNQKKEAKGNKKSDKVAPKKTSGAKSVELEQLSETVAKIVKEMNVLIMAKKAENEEADKAKKERDENRYKLLSMSE